MKIIFDNQKEYDEFLDTCHYLHDFSVFVKGISKKTKIEVVDKWGQECVTERIKPQKGSRWVGFSLDFEKYPALNFLVGMYDCDDKNIRKKYLEIKRSNED